MKKNKNNSQVEEAKSKRSTSKTLSEDRMQELERLNGAIGLELVIKNKPK